MVALQRVECGIESEGLEELCEARRPTRGYVPQEDPEGSPFTEASHREGGRTRACITRELGVLCLLQAGMTVGEGGPKVDSLMSMGRVWPWRERG